MTDLHASWVRAWKGIGSRTDGNDICEALMARYSEAHRKYHTLQHLRECLALLDTVRRQLPRADEIEVALWFHDAIYDVRRADNEAKSADWAGQATLDAGVDAQVAQRIQALVLVTRHTGAPVGDDQLWLVDIDLSILGSGKARFAEYERQIRKEYSHVPSELFERKRSEILRSFLDRPRIYNTAHFHDMLEAPARENLRLAIGRSSD